jgi:hypothetical protein
MHIHARKAQGSKIDRDRNELTEVSERGHNPMDLKGPETSPENSCFFHA